MSLLQNIVSFIGLFCKRDLSTTCSHPISQRALCPCLTGKEPDTATKEPYVIGKMPCITEKEPTKKEPTERKKKSLVSLSHWKGA